MSLRLIVLFGFLLLLEFLLPPLRAEYLIDLSAIFILSLLSWQLLKRKALSNQIYWLRWLAFGLSLIYLIFLILEAQKISDWWAQPNETWRSLMHSWFALIAIIVGLSSTQVIRFFSQIQNHPPRFIALIYTGFALASTILLVLPISLKPGYSLSYLDAFFTSVSAISGTGLIVSNTAETFSTFGQFVLLIVIQAGGIGIITFSGLLLLLIGKKLGLKERVVQDDLENLWFFRNLKQFVIFVSTVALIAEIVGAILIYPFMRARFDNFFEAAFHSIFQSVSAFCTAGFSTLPQGMIEADGHPFVLFVVGGLSIFGMLGIPTLLGILKFFDPTSLVRRLGAYAKMELWLAIGLLLFGTLSLFFIEAANDIYSSTWDRFVDAFFQSSQRASGFNSVVIRELEPASLFILMPLMFIAGAPMSTAGGVKTATIGIVLIFAYSFLKGRHEASFANRRISSTLLTKAVTLIVCYLGILFFGFISLNFIETATSFELFFEALSALSVCGFSLGITESLSDGGKTIIIILMMLGRIGILTGLYAILQDRRPERYRHPIGDFYVG